MSTNVLAARDINTSAPHAPKANSKPTMESGEDTKSMEYHRQILQSKLADDGYVLLSRANPELRDILHCPATYAFMGSGHSLKGCANALWIHRHKTTYISPSDTIMSPTTQKLAGMRQKRFMKAKPQSLFAKTSSKNMLSPPSSKTTTSGLDGVLNDSITIQGEKKEDA
ncbi:hypothetical protein MMC26_002333 [Xylographa opegraphella]|nr:hypothetical protein [Xylographa opegraphella]